MTIKNKPYSSLPWSTDGAYIRDAGNHATFGSDQYYPWVETLDFEHIVHAVNAYPKLVELVKEYADEYGHGRFGTLLEELGEDAHGD